ncbi:MAG: type II toxin-antitoxin system RelE/ParE family toxin [Planctomycetales bacterium]|nr:type II toxin-antitoxin system RelE/ParE family toxin [Planctomycetales bacterium]
MALKVILTAEAFRQIEQIGDYISRDSPEHALRWVERLLAFTETLVAFPEKHEVIYTAAQAGREVRQALFGVYRVLYEVQPKAVYVLSVRHGARQPMGPEELGSIE